VVFFSVRCRSCCCCWEQNAEKYTGDKTDLISGANIAAFRKVAEAMLAQGCV
jgi:glutamate dehydrogenase/leucine dehydrogenase